MVVWGRISRRDCTRGVVEDIWFAEEVKLQMATGEYFGGKERKMYAPLKETKRMRLTRRSKMMEMATEKMEQRGKDDSAPSARDISETKDWVMMLCCSPSQPR